MNLAPKIGQRVSFRGSKLVGPCTGVVTFVWRVPYDGDQAEWQVAVRVERKPRLWDWGDGDCFATAAKHLIPLEK